MHATVRRYEGIDKARTDELTKKVDETLMPSLSKLPGFSGYFLIKGENDVITSIDLFNDSKQASDSTRIASEWIRNEQLENVRHNPPKATDSDVTSRT